MVRTGSFFFRLLAFLVVIGILIVGGAALHRAGFTQGYAQGIAAGSAGNSQADSGVPSQLVPYYPGYGFGWGYPHFGFFPLAGFLGIIFFALLFLGAMRLLFRPHFWGPMGTYPKHRHGYPPEWGIPPEAHGNQPDGPSGEGQENSGERTKNK